MKKLIAHLKDYTNVTWNNNEQMVVDGKSGPDTNTAVSVNDILPKARHAIDLVRRKALIDQLRKTETHRCIVSNADVARE